MNEQSPLNLNKKILLISSWAPPKIGGAQNLYNIFKYINRNDYYIITRDDNLINQINFGDSLPCKYYYFPQEKNRIKKLVKTTCECRKIIKKEKIDLIIAISDGGFSFFVTFLLSILANKSYLLFFFDLWKGNIFATKNNFINFFERILFKRAKKIIVTNSATRDYYKNLYKRQNEKIEIIYNSVPADIYKNIAFLKKDAKNIKKVLFTGNIYWPQEKSLENLLDLVSNEKIDNIQVDVYCPLPPENLTEKYRNHQNIKFLSASQAEMPKIQNEADILFLPLSWNTEAPDIIKTASPGKLTDYLIAGRPILIHAPNYSFVAKYARENNFAEVVDTENQDSLKEGILKIINDDEYSRRLVDNAQKVFYRNHDAIKNSEKLVNIINNL